jgi:hypothetical protein
MVVSTDSSGVAWRRSQSNNTGEAVGGLEDGKVPAGGAEELSGKHGPKAGHAQQHLSVLVLGDFPADQLIECSEFLVQGEDFPGKCGNDRLPMCWVYWDLAASIAAAATAAEERAPFFFSRAWILASPVRRIPSGVRCLVSRVNAALERL